MRRKIVTGAVVIMLLLCLMFTSFSLQRSKAASSEEMLTLTVLSAHGNPSPSVGDHYYTMGEKVTCEVPIYAVENGTEWECDGCGGSGSLPLGYCWTTNVTFYINQNTTISWDWHERIFPPPNTNTVLAFAKSSYSFKVGEPFNITVSVQNVLDLQAWQLALIFDPNVIQYSGLSIPHDNVFGDQDPSIAVYNIEADYGYLAIGVGPATPVHFDGSGDLCTFTFIGRSMGSTFLRFRDYHYETFLLDNIGRDIPYVMTESLARFSSLRTDINSDGVVNVRDVHAAVLAFNSFLGSARWNAFADVDDNGRVDMRDIMAIAIDFGKSV